MTTTSNQPDRSLTRGRVLLASGIIIERQITARPTMRATLSHPELPGVSIEIECDLFGEPAERTTSFRMPLLEQLSGAAAAAAPQLIEAAANELRAASALAWRLTDLLLTATTRTIEEE